jgi:threonine dehydrogenase-like Zn-dependent dehydrogenase
MKAFILNGKGEAAWGEVPTPEIGSYDALVRVTCVATCTTDVHQIETANISTLIGKALGHEAVGVVEKVGADVKDFKPGDRVVIPVAWSDFRHPKAQRHEAKYYQTNSPYFSASGLNGHFAEFSKVVDADMALAKIPDSVTDSEAVMLPDMAGTALTGAEYMNIDYGDTVVILGIGPVGLMGVAGAALKGAGRIIGVGSRAKTKELAKYYGATDIVDYHDGDVYEQIMALTGGKPVDSVMIASGGDANEQFELALKLVKWGGDVSNVSMWNSNQTLTIPFDLLYWGVQDKHIHTALVEDGRDIMERYLNLVEHGKLDTKPLVTHTFHGWDHLEDGLALMESRDPEVIKPVVIID